MMNELSHNIASPFAHPLYVMAKPVGAQCNLACRYCYYLEKQKLYPLDYAHGRQIDNCIQTNGTLLTDEWCEFFKENHFLVGVSIDGPQEFHDEYRRSRLGKPSWRDVMRGIRLLNKHGVE